MKKIIILLSIFVFTSCNQEDEIIDLTLKKGKPEKVTICHYNPHNDTYKTISVNEKQLAKHLEHGDRVGGGCEDYTYVPDDLFEQNLIGLGYDDVLDDYVLTANINTIETLTLNTINEPEEGIEDFTGIEDFKAVKIINFRYFILNTILDLSELTSLVEITFFDVDFGNNFSLAGNFTSFIFNDGSARIDLDLSNVPNLENLSIQFLNSSAGLNLQNNTKLKNIEIILSPMNPIDLSNNIALESIYLEDVNFVSESLDLSNHIFLKQFFMIGHNLSILNVKNGNNSSLTSFMVGGNETLTCIQVDNEIDANAGIGVYAEWDSSGTTFSEDCGY